MKRRILEAALSMKLRAKRHYAAELAKEYIERWVDSGNPDDLDQAISALRVGGGE